MKLLTTSILLTILTILAESKDEVIALAAIGAFVASLVAAFVGILKIIDWFRNGKDKKKA